MLVVDASVIVKLVVDEPGTEVARAVVTARDDCVAPDLLTIEVASALAKKVRSQKLAEPLARLGMDNFAKFLSELTDTRLLIDHAATLSIATDHSLFDCIYLALAIERDCPVLTADVKFAVRAIAGGHGAHIRTLHPLPAA